MSRLARWAPPFILGAGALLTVGVAPQRTLSLRLPLASTIPAAIDSFHGRDFGLGEDERRVSGVTDYLVRTYAPARAAGDRAAFTLYVGYYDSQAQGKTIHSPKNCLPGAGWEPLASGTATLTGPDGPVAVNRYVLQHGAERAVVLYWYQGRGRVAANEYRVKWDLLRDAALRRRSDEALVRLVVPVTSTEDQALTLGSRAAERVIPALYRALPR